MTSTSLSGRPDARPTDKDLIVRVWRTSASDAAEAPASGAPQEGAAQEGAAQQGTFQEFRVARRASQTVLDVVSEIQRAQDPTLAYRFACRVGMCGSCAMVVNGRPRWTCRTRVEEACDGDELVLEPLRNMPLVKDLAVEMTPFFEKWQKAHGYFEPGEAPANDFAVVEPKSAQRREADAGIECINCGVCYSACDVVAWNADYLGPAALNRAWTLVNDVRDKGQAARLAAISGDVGCHSCHSHMSCTEYCPKSLGPTFAIAGLKRATALGPLSRFFSSLVKS